MVVTKLHASARPPSRTLLNASTLYRPQSSQCISKMPNRAKVCRHGSIQGDNCRGYCFRLASLSNITHRLQHSPASAESLCPKLAVSGAAMKITTYTLILSRSGIPRLGSDCMQCLHQPPLCFSQIPTQLHPSSTMHDGSTSRHINTTTSLAYKAQRHDHLHLSTTRMHHHVCHCCC